MKKFITKTLIFAICICGILVPSNVKAIEPVYNGINNDEYIVTRITDEQGIKEYLEEMGEEYDPNLLEVYRIEQEVSKENTNISSNTRGIFSCEYFIKNKKIETKTDTSKLLKQYNRPAGIISINESVSISNTYNVSGKVTVKILEAQLGYSLTETKNYSISWSNTFTEAVTIKIFPVYEVTTGEVWEDDVFFDDNIGSFTAKRAVGDDIRVYSQN